MVIKKITNLFPSLRIRDLMNRAKPQSVMRSPAVDLNPTLSDIIPSTDYRPLEEIVSGVIGTSAVNAGTKLGLFRELMSGPRTVAELSQKLGIAERPIDILLTTYQGFNLTEAKAPDRYSLTPEAERYLSPSSPDNVLGKLKIAEKLWKTARIGDRGAGFKLITLGAKMQGQMLKDIFGVTKTAALVMGHQSRIFDTLQKGMSRIEVLAQRHNFTLPEARQLLAALLELGLVRDYHPDVFCLSELTHDNLDRSKPNYFGYTVDMVAAPWNKTLSDEIVRSARVNGPVISDSGNIWQDHMSDQEAARFFARNMFNGSIQPGQAISDKLPDLTETKLLLDVAGGPGAIPIAILKDRPFSRAIVTDVAPTDYGQSMAELFGVGKRLEFRRSDMFTEPFPSGADCVLISQIIHDWSDSKNQALVHKIFKYLPPGGRVLVHERLFDADRKGPLMTTLQNVFMLLWTEGRQYTENELQALLQSAGFEAGSAVPTAGGFSVMTGVKRS